MAGMCGLPGISSPIRRSADPPIRRCADRNAQVIDSYLYLAAAIVTIRQLIQRARTLYRWYTRPATRRLK